ncbi:MAG: alpha/beta fold hydrolase [Polyangiaceae bacterium]
MNRSRVVALLALSLSQSPSRCSKSEGQPTLARESPPPAPGATPPPDASAPETPFERELDALDQSSSFSEVTLSGDGSKLAWVESFVTRGADTSTSVVRALDRSDPAAKPRTITAGASARRERDVAWSPDGKTLAFLSDAPGKDRTELYIAMPDDAHASPRKLTDLVGAISAPHFSPDGKTIAVLFAENATNLGPIEAVAPVRGEAEAHVPVQRLALVDATSGQVRSLTRADLYVYEYAWSPDGAQFAVIAAPPPGDRHWYVAKLFVVDGRTGQERLLFAPPRQIAHPRWSPDGKEIAFIGGLMSDEGSTGGDVFVVPSDGSAVTHARDWTEGFHGSAQSLAWPKGDRIVFRAIVDGANAIEAVDGGGKVEALWSGGDSSLHDLALSNDGTVSAVARESFSTPEELSAGQIGKWQQVTHVNEGLHATWGKARSLTWKSDGRDVQGWLVEPSVVDPKNRAPLVVFVHGGPASAARPSFGAALAGEGYFLFYPNPRGSFGQGEAFTSANVKDFGYGDMRDILSGVDEVLRTAPVDGNRMGVVGWSYGGFMAMWMVTQTTRFRAAIAGAGIANWQSYWGENEISDWMIPYFGASVYDDPKVYARSSPIEFIKQAKTPTLILVGENDGECPAPQSFEFWRGLQAQGVETQLVVYPGEGHGFRKAEHRRDRSVRILHWFDAHLGTGRE